MHQNSGQFGVVGGKPTGFERFAFSEKMIRFQHRFPKDICDLRPLDLTNDASLLERIRAEMTIANNDAIGRVIARHPAAVRRVAFRNKSPDHDGLFAYLPLNQGGFDALLTGRLNGLCPEENHICATGEVPEAIYIWLMYMPHSGGRAMGALGHLFDGAAPKACPIFSKAINLHAAQLNTSLGFLPAEKIYPNAAKGLLVVLPHKAMDTSDHRHMDVRIVRDIGDFAKAIAIRSATYMAEQFCHFDEEFDGNDLCSTHWLGYAGTDPAGCIRARFFNGFAKIERLAVRAEYRNSRLAYQLVREAISHCQRKGYQTLYGHSRLDLVRFWRVFGFQPIENKAVFEFADVRYVEMRCSLEPCDNPITLDADPMVLIRPEGAWDRPGPFDIPPPRPGIRRHERIAESTRTVAKQIITA
jgi:predicted GNAT family N-acyltransferase